MIATLTLGFALMATGQEGGGRPARPFLHPLFTDHVVLQRDVPTPIWGWAEPGTRVKVALAGQSVETTTNDQGKWMARLGPYPAGGPHVLSVTGPKLVEVQDVLVGDVWLCSGQSNMEWPLKLADNAGAELAAANHPRLRLFQVGKKIALEPEATVEAKWETCTTRSADGFTAVGYFFGRDLQRELGVPIGLINSSWGGTIAEAWTSAEALEPMGDFARALAQARAERSEPKGPPLKFAQAMANWWKRNDPGSADPPGWADPRLDAADWKKMDLPGHWEERGLGDFDGVAWFRKEFDLPEAWDGKALTLNLGAIDDRDTTFVNGVEVGHAENWMALRSYKVPAALAKAGRMVIAVRVLDTSGKGGFAGPADAMKVRPEGDDRAEPIALTGPWAYKASAPMSDLASPPEIDGENPNKVTLLYNGMIAPLTPFPIKGAIWYQGESNASRAAQYRRLLPTMIRDWRDRFGVGDFPFLIVQLANYRDRRDVPDESEWAELRESQFLATRSLPNVAVALAIDIGDAKDIHPTNKQEVGRRLALDALAMTYGKDVESSGPVFKAAETSGRSIRLTFDHLGGGLVAKGGKLEGFAIAAADGKFRRAEAAIEGDAVVVTSPDVETPTQVRYAWADNPACNLYNQAGLPAVPFRTNPPAPGK